MDACIIHKYLLIGVIYIKIQCYIWLAIFHPAVSQSNRVKKVSTLSIISNLIYQLFYNLIASFVNFFGNIHCVIVTYLYCSPRKQFVPYKRVDGANNHLFWIYYTHYRQLRISRKMGISLMNRW